MQLMLEWIGVTERVHYSLSVSQYKQLNSISPVAKAPDGKKKKKKVIHTIHSGLSNTFESVSLLQDFISAVQMLTDRVDGDKWNCFVRMARGEQRAQEREREKEQHRENEFSWETEVQCLPSAELLTRWSIITGIHVHVYSIHRAMWAISLKNK